MGISDSGVGVELRLLLPQVEAACMQWIVDHQHDVAKMVQAAMTESIEKLDIGKIIQAEIDKEIRYKLEGIVRLAVRDASVVFLADLERALAEVAKRDLAATIERVVKQRT